MIIEYNDIETGESVEINHGNFNEEIPCVGDTVNIKMGKLKYFYTVTKRVWNYQLDHEKNKQYFETVTIYLKVV